MAVSTGLCVGLVLFLFCRRDECRGDTGFFATRLFCPPFLLGSSLSFGGLRGGVLWLFGVLYAPLRGILPHAFLWKIWVIVLQHLYRCYVEYHLNTRVSI